MDDDTDGPLCPIEILPGEPCGEPSTPAAPFPICTNHMAELFVFVQRSLDWQAKIVNVRQPIQTGRGVPVVYYLAFHSLIKIGWSRDLEVRLRSYPIKWVLLATEPGSLKTERRRHDMFEHLRTYPGTQRELFAPGSDLVAHVNALRGVQGCGPVSLASEASPVARQTIQVPQ